MKKVTIILMSLIILGFAAVAQSKATTPVSVNPSPAAGRKHVSNIKWTPAKVQPSKPGATTGNLKPASEASTGKATGK